MNISDVVPILKLALKVDDSVLLEGKHGIGKSQIVEQYTKMYKLFYTELFLSQQEIGDLIGIPQNIPKNGEMITQWAKPIWLQRMEIASWPDVEIDDLDFKDDIFGDFIKNKIIGKELGHLISRNDLMGYYKEHYEEESTIIDKQNKILNRKSKKCVLFLDELNRAQTDVLSASLQLILQRRIHEHILPIVDGTRTQIIACTNPADEDYQVQSFDPALLDRFMKIEVTADVESWLEWSRKNKVNKIVRSFILDNPGKLHFTEDGDTTDGVGATPRSWTMLGKIMDHIDEVPEEVKTSIISGKVGTSIGGEFYLFYKNYKNNIGLDDITKFVMEKYNNTNKDIIKTSILLKEFISEAEPHTKLEHAKTLFEDKKTIEVLNNGKKGVEGIVVLSTLLHSFELETLASFLKDIKENSKDEFILLMQKDDDRVLANKITSKLNTKN